MKNILKKGSKFFLTALVILNSLMNTLPVHAEETTTDENDLDTIVELGNAEDVFPDLMPQSDGISLTDTTGTGSIYAMIHIANQYGFDYVQQLYVGDKTVFCIEPMQLFTEGLDYHQDTAKWDELSEQTRQNIWEINYYGFSYSGHQTEKYYVATQVMIWQAVTGTWYQPYYTDGTTVYDISNEVAVINNLRAQPQGRPSFNNQTIKMGLNAPVTLTDTKGTLANYSITSSNGISASVNGNNLTVAITSENYDKSITFSRNFTARDVNVIYGSGGYQRVIYLASRRDPSPNFNLNFDLMYADIEVEKQDSQTGTKTQGDATFNGATFAIKDTSGNVLETITTNGSKAKSKKYPVGTTLNVCEVTSPEGYLTNSSCNTVELKYSGDNTTSTFSTTVKDQVIKGRIEIAKTIDKEKYGLFQSNVQKPGEGFKFDIILKSTGKVVSTLTTDEDGRAISDYLPYGTYIVKEHETAGYDILEPFEVKIDKDQKTYFYNIYNDTIKAELTIYKTDSETGKRIPAAGVEFKIKDADGNYVTQEVTYPKKYTTDVFKTDEDGSVHLPSPLKYGEYKLVELKAPHGYVLKDTEIPINVDGSSTEIFMNFDNKTQKGQVYVEKSGEMLSGAKESKTDYGTLYTPEYKEKYLSGVTYEITAREDIVTPEGTVWFHKGDVVDTFTTGDGVTTSALLQLGKYSIKETATQTGFVLDGNTYDFDIEYAGQMIDVVEIKQSYVNERQKLDLQITKTFEDEDKDAYKDVVFGVYSKNDITLNDKVIIPADGLVGTLTIDEDGKNIEQLDLPTGEYYVKELETNVGFKLDEEKHDFTFDYDEDTTKSTVTVSMNLYNEKRRLELDVNKVDKDHHDHFLNGAIFEVYDKTADAYVTTLASGQLMITGEEKDEEYEISKKEDFSKIIKTVKTDENKQIVLDIDDDIYYSRKVGDDKVTKHVVKDGKAVLADAIYGHEYEFKEIKAPTSYQLADKSKAYKVEADEETDTIIYYFENARIVVPNTGV
ncbi:SpaA isopeptide-forming pilin-related protein [uncultured Holdemanella sp.]|uniref:SpaA isopeptide-forming pilin-related protein n=1 Tax=uncultured Holdemanella sp. TaxID=1763549 RepID=UPI0025E359BC|nr:SpaA isopeptide-forming pilin-related protein [uncultured Holdemanella sp.]